MKRTLPLLITAVSGLVMIVAFFIPYTLEWGETVAIWFDIMAAIAFILGGGNLLMVHLRKVSEQRAGWGFSVVTLVSFIATLSVGLLKVGVSPSPLQEGFGETWVALDLDQMPVSATVAGTLPTDMPLPVSVRLQMSADESAGQLTFHGWMTEEQQEDLKDFWLDSRWWETVDKLYEAASPPAELAGNVGYYAVPRRLSYTGAMNDEDHTALLALGTEPPWTAAVDALDEMSNQIHTVPLAELPAGITIPADLSGQVRFDAEKKTLEIRGPMTAEIRAQLLGVFPRGTPLTDEERAKLKEELTSAGPLNSKQQEALSGFLLDGDTAGQRNMRLYRLVRQEGPLNATQRDVLLDGYRAEIEWRQTVGQLVVASHQTKYPWSGVYNEPGSPFNWLYEYAFKPLTASMFAMLAFYVASAAFRAFRAKNFEAVLLLGTAFIILLGRTYLGTVLSDWLPDALSFLRIDNLTLFIMKIVNTAGNRAIMIGIALGIVSTSLKVLLGVDRSYLGGGGD